MCLLTDEMKHNLLDKVKSEQNKINVTEMNETIQIMKCPPLAHHLPTDREGL